MNASAFIGIAGASSSRTRTGIPGIGLALVSIHGKKQLHITAHCGQKTKKFNTVRLGRQVAFRRALVIRAQYERSAK